MVPDRIRPFVAGTGGKPLYSDAYTKIWAFSEALDLNSYGIPRIELHPGSYNWEFVPTKPNAASM
jgi:hypothetical protein